jgi:hypothetical protein
VGSQADSQSPEEVERHRQWLSKTVGDDGLFRVMDELDLDFVCSCTDGPISSIAAMAGTFTLFEAEADRQPVRPPVCPSDICVPAAGPLDLLSWRDPAGRPSCSRS